MNARDALEVVLDSIAPGRVRRSPETLSEAIAVLTNLVERAGEPVAYQVSDGYAKVPRKISEQDADIIGMPVAWYERAVATAERLGNPTAYTLPPPHPEPAMSDDKLWDNAFSHAEAVIGLSRSDNVGGLVAKWRAEADINAPRLLHPEACEAKRECADELEATLSAHGGLLFTQGDMERFAGYVADAREERLKSAHGQPVVDGVPPEAVEVEGTALLAGAVKLGDWAIPTQCGARIVDARMAYGWNECRKAMLEAIAALTGATQ